MNLFVKSSPTFQRLRNISRKHEMPLNSIVECEVFDLWCVHFMGHFVSLFSNMYILVCINYISKRVKVVASPTSDHRVVMMLFKKTIFARFKVLRVIISDGGFQFAHGSSTNF